MKIKQKQKHKIIFDKFEKEYGTFINCHADHLKHILNNKDIETFLPSLMVLMTHLNKTKEYIKSFRSIGKFPKNLEHTDKQLSDIANNYYNRYKGHSKDTLIQLYTNNALEHPIIQKYGCKDPKRIYCTLQAISNAIGNVKKNKIRKSVI